MLPKSCSTWPLNCLTQTLPNPRLESCTRICTFHSSEIDLDSGLFTEHFVSSNIFHYKLMKYMGQTSPIQNRSSACLHEREASYGNDHFNLHPACFIDSRNSIPGVYPKLLVLISYKNSSTQLLIFFFFMFVFTTICKIVWWTWFQIPFLIPVSLSQYLSFSILYCQKEAPSVLCFPFLFFFVRLDIGFSWCLINHLPELFIFERQLVKEISRKWSGLITYYLHWCIWCFLNTKVEVVVTAPILFTWAKFDKCPTELCTS